MNWLADTFVSYWFITDMIFYAKSPPPLVNLDPFIHVS